MNPKLTLTSYQFVEKRNQLNTHFREFSGAKYHMAIAVVEIIKTVVQKLQKLSNTSTKSEKLFSGQ